MASTALHALQFICWSNKHLAPLNRSASFPELKMPSCCRHTSSAHACHAQVLRPSLKTYTECKLNQVTAKPRQSPYPCCCCCCCCCPLIGRRCAEGFAELLLLAPCLAAASCLTGAAAGAGAGAAFAGAAAGFPDATASFTAAVAGPEAALAACFAGAGVLAGAGAGAGGASCTPVLIL
jgi:hypothetical protein